MRLKQILCNRLDLSKDLLVFIQDILEFIEVHLELDLLKQNNPGSFWNLDVLPFQAFCLADKLENCDIEVNIKGTSIGFTNDKGGLKACFCPFDVFAPGTEEPLLIDLEFQSNGIITSKLCLQLILCNSCLGELMNRSSNLLEQMSCPDDLSSLRWHVSDNGRILFCVFIKLFLDAFKFSRISVQNVIIFVLQIMPKRVSLQNILKLGQQL